MKKSRLLESMVPKATIGPPQVLPLVLFLKLLGVGALFAGSVGAVLPHDIADRRRFAYAVAGPGFGVSWGCGFGLAGLTSQSLLSTWAIGSMALSLFSIQAVLWSVGKEGRRGPGAWVAILAPLVGTLALMVWRP
jgi:hypothetical protein